jgi:ferric-dicitrate binding protein FerR (iron transport regulator)
MGRRAFVTTAIGASVAAVLLARIDLDGVFGSGGAGRLRTAVGEQRRVDVVPGVTVEMNTATDIALRGTGKAVTGMRLRSGEAVVRIDASRKARFVVDIGDATVASTPGSAVAVRCIDSESVVTCLDGQALLSLGSTESLVKPAQQVSFDARGIAAAVAVNPDTALAWRNRVLIYDNQPLAQVVADINRYRPGRIVITDRALGERRVHARFTLDQMADVATLIQDAYGAHATHLPGGWVLLS